MALTFQYNKTALQKLQKDLRIRENALPILAAKESALRLEVKKARQEEQRLARELQERLAAQAAAERLWGELPPGLARVTEVKLSRRKIAGVDIPEVGEVVFAVAPYSLVNSPAWLPAGLEALRSLLELRLRGEVAGRRLVALEYARKKTTQKVNLYEKVQIPEYKTALLKIKRFMEDEDNLSKSSQKILKSKMELAEAVA